MKNSTLTHWDSKEWNSELVQSTKAHSLRSTDSAIIRISCAIDYAFTPIDWALSDALKARKKQLVDVPRSLGCAILLTKSTKDTAYLVGTKNKTLCADLSMNPLDFLKLPMDKSTVGPIAVQIFRQAIEKFEQFGGYPSDIAKEVVQDFEDNDYSYTFTIKNTAIKRSDYRIKVDVTESYEKTSARLIISSIKNEISKTINFYERSRPHPTYDDGQDEIPGIDPNRHGALPINALATVDIDANGIHFGPSPETQLASVISTEPIEKDYAITLTSRELGPEISSALKIRCV